MNKAVFFVSVLGAVIAAMLPQPASAGGFGGDVYRGAEVRQMHVVVVAEVVDIRNVRVNTQSWQSQAAGAGIGSVVGGALGSKVGHGNGRLVAGTIGAVVGAVAGNKVDEMLSDKAALEFTLKLSDGRFVAITQEADAQSAGILVGDNVRVLQGNGVVRVAPMGRRT